MFSKTPEEHLERLRGVFDKFTKAGLKLKPSKCEFFKSKITYLGHIVSAAGIETDPKKIEAVKNWMTPKTVTDIRSFLGFNNHYHRFIRGYAKVASPLNTLVLNDNTNKKKAAVDWTNECQEAFEKLKDLCITTPIQPMPIIRSLSNYKLMLVTLVLVQCYIRRMMKGDKESFAYVRRSLSHTEWNYFIHKLEFLALKWAITNRFHEYLYGGQFEVYTDNNPLTYILTSAKLDATRQR